MPKPKKGETRQEYVARAIPQIMREGETQRVAIGKAYGMFSYYRKKKKEEVDANKKKKKSR